MKVRAAKHSLVSAKLLEQIRAGRYLPGDLLPSEPELCRRHRVSRQTVRVALRSLYEKGLIRSHQGRGSVVQAAAVDPRYAFACDSIADLLQFAAATPRKLLDVARIEADEALARWLDTEPGAFWWRVHTCRLEKRGGPSIASSLIYVPDAYAGAVRALSRSPLPLFALMEKRYGHQIAQVKQSFSVARASADEARDLGLEPGASVMCVERRYTDDRGQLLEVSRNVHPPDAFQYEMTVRRIIGHGPG
jgi:DNA-binding GntR family transcriptional regulator